MSGLLYLIQTPDRIPAVSDNYQPVRERLRDCGFGLIADLKLQVGKVERGPDNLPAWIISYETKSGCLPKVAYQPDKQKWLETSQEGSRRAWVGHWLAESPPAVARPLADDLERPEVYHGMRFYWESSGLNLPGEENLRTWWALPIIPVDLPKAYSINGTGDEKWAYNQKLLDRFLPIAERHYNARAFIEGLVKEQFEIEDRLKEDSEQGNLKEEERGGLLRRRNEISELIPESYCDDMQSCRDVIELLSLNYYIGKYEAALLELLTPRFVDAVIQISLRDRPALLAELEAKKKGSTVSATSST